MLKQITHSLLELVAAYAASSSATRSKYLSCWMVMLACLMLGTQVQLKANTSKLNVDLPFAPTVVSIAISGNPNTAATNISFVVTFSESVTGVDLSDFEIDKTSLVSATLSSISGSGSVYTVGLTDVGGFGTLSIDLKVSGTGISGVSGSIVDGFKDGAFHLVGETYDITQAIYTGERDDLNVESQTEVPYSLDFDGTGLKLFVLAPITNGATIFEYDLSSPYDISTASYAGDVESFTYSEPGLTFDFQFNGDGTKLYFLEGFRSGRITTFTLSTPYDVSTAVDAGSTITTTIPGLRMSLRFNQLGSKMYVIGTSSALVYSYNLSTNFDVSTAVVSGAPFSLVADGISTNLTSISFTPDGERFFASANRQTLEYALTTPFDLSTASLLRRSTISNTAGSFYFLDLEFNSDGTKVFVLEAGSIVGIRTETMEEYSLAEPVITGSVIDQNVNDNASISPFASIIVADPNQDPVSALITLDDDSKGTLSGNGLSGTGPYTMASTDFATLQNQLRALSFVPTANRVAIGSTEKTTFTLELSDGVLSDTDIFSSVISNPVAPSATISSAEGTVTNGAFTTTITFTESVSGFEASDLVMANGTAGTLSTNDNITYTTTVTPTPGFNGSLTIDLPANRVQDAGASDNVAASQFSIQIDQQSPGVAISTSAVAPATGPFLVTITFDEAVTGFNSSDIIVVNGVIDGFTTVSTTEYTLNITPSATGTITVNVPADAAQDAAENGNTAATEFSIAASLTNPSVVIESASNSAINGAFDVTFTFSEAVTNFIAADVTATNATVGALSTADGGLTYTGTITPVASGAVVLSVPSDVAESIATGNGNSVSSPFNRTFDNAGPTVGISSGVGATNGPFTTTFTFSEDVTGFGLDDITLGNGTAFNLATLSATTYTVTITPNSDFNGVLTIDMAADRVNDLAGNGNTISSQKTVTIDQTKPSVSVSTNVAGSETNQTSYTATFTFSEDVTGFNLSDISVTNGVKSNFVQVSASVYTATISPTVQGPVVVNVPAVRAQDTSGNNNTASNNLTLIYDFTQPLVNISGSALENGPFTATFTFTEVVTGFAVGDIQITNGTVSNLTSADGITYTALITPAADGALTLSVTGSTVLDNAGNSNPASDTFTTSIDSSVPTVSVSGPAGPVNGDFTTTFTFSEEVNGFVNTDVSLVNATMGALSTSDNITYTATVTPTSDGSIQIDVPSGAVSDNAGNDNSASNSYTVVSDLTRPTVTITTLGSATATSFRPINVSVTFSEDVTGFDASDLNLLGGTIASFTANSASSYTIRVTPDNPSAGNIFVNVAENVAQDLASNGNTAATELEFTVDQVSPVLTIDTGLPSGATNAAYTATFTFSEPVTGFELSDLEIINGTLSDFVQTDASNYSVLVTPTSDGTVTLNVAARAGIDEARLGNDAVSSSVTFDGSQPTVSVTTDLATGRTNSPFTATITFSEDVTGFAFEDIEVTNGSASDFTVNTTDRVFTVLITPAADGDVIIRVPAEAAADGVGNLSTLGETTIIADTVSPEVIITSTISNGVTIDPFLVVINFNDKVNDFDINDITVSNGIVSNFITLLPRLTFQVLITPTVGGDVTVDVLANVVQDLAGNPNLASNTFRINYDLIRPTVVVTSESSSVNGPFTATFTFDEDVVNFDINDIGLTNGLASDFAVVSANEYTATITPLSESLVRVSVPSNAAEDLVGNLNQASSILNVNVDSTAPTVTVSGPGTDVRSAFTATITFSEDVTGFELSDISASNASLSNFSQVNGQTYNVTVTPTLEGLVTLQIPAGAAIDVATNQSTESNLLSINYDATRPSVVVSSASDRVNGPFTATFTFDEDVLNFDVNDIGLTNGVASDFTVVSPSVYTATITPQSESIVRVSVPSNTANDAAGNVNQASSILNLTADFTRPTSQLSQLATHVNSAFTTTITFSEAMTNFDLGDLTITNGTASNLVAVNSSSFTATITPAADGLVTVGLAENVANDLAGNGNIAAPTVSTTFDGTRPSLAITTSANPANGPFTATFTFSEAVTGFEASDITITNGTVGSLSTSDNITYTSTITPTTSFTGSLTLDVFEDLAEDSAGNGNTPASQRTIAVDQSRPSVSVSVPSGPANVPFTATFTFSEVVTGFEASDINITNGILSNFTEVSPDVYTATVTPTADGTVTVEVPADAAQDSAGNGNEASSSSVTFDSARPSLAITTSADPANGPFTATFIFSEAVTGFEASDITITNGTVGSFSTADNITYTSTITPTTSFTGSLTLDVFEDLAEDSAGNGNTPASQRIIAVDQSRPSVSVSVPSGPANVPFTATFTFSEAVTGFEASDINITNGILSNFTEVSPDVYTATVTPTADGTVTVEVPADAAQDSAGNGNEASSSSVTFDSARPSLAITTSANPANGPFTATFTFSEAVTGFEASDITVANGSIGALSTSDNITYTTTITPTTSFTGSLTLDVFENLAEDSAGNGNTPASQRIIAVDQSRPSVSVSVPSGPANVPFTATFTFSEAVTGFEASDINITNGILSNFTEVSPDVYTATVTPTADGTVTVEVPADAAQDSAGNGNEASSSSVTFDSARPSLAITTSADPANGPFTATFIFSEAVTGFEASDITITNGTVGSLSTADNITYTSTITPTTSFTGNLTLDVVADIAIDGAGNGNTLASQLVVAVDQPINISIDVLGLPSKDAETVDFTVSFSTDVTGVDISDFSIDKTSLVQASIGSISGSGSQYTVTVNNISGIGNLGIDLNVSGTGIVNVSGNEAPGFADAPYHVVGDAYDISAATYTGDDDRLSIFGSVESPTAMRFDKTGLKLFVLGSNTSSNQRFINTYDLTSAFDISTATYAGDANRLIFVGFVDQKSFQFNADGTKIILINSNSTASISYNYSLSVPYDLSSAGAISFSSVRPISEVKSIVSMEFNLLGTKMFVLGASTKRIEVYNLSTPFEATTATYAGAASGFSLAGLTLPESFSFSKSGFKMFAVDEATGIVHEYDLTTRFDVSTAVLVGSEQNFSVQSEEAQPNKIVFNDDGTKFYILGKATPDGQAVGKFIYEYTVLRPEISGAVSDQSVSTIATINPFANIITTHTIGANISATITLDDNAKGVLSGVGLSGSGPYTIASTSPAGLQQILRGLVFDPADTRVAAGVSEKTIFTLEVTDGTASDTDNNTSVISIPLAPTLNISTPSTPVNGAFTVVYTFSQAVTGFELGDAIISNGTGGALNTTDNITFTSEITPNASFVGDLTIAVNADVAQNAFGQGNEAAAEFRISADLVSPTLIIATSADPTNGPFTATFTFSEAVTGFEASDITIANGTVGSMSTSDNITYTTTITPTTSFTGSLTLDVFENLAEDSAGNGNTPASQRIIAVDQSRPSVSVSIPSGPANVPFTATFTFSEAVTGFEASDINLTNGTLSNFTEVSPGVYTATVTPTADGTVTVEVPADVAQDAAGNPNTASTETSTTNFDTTSPSVVISTDVTTTNGPFTATFTFSEAVTGFEASDITIANGTVSNLTEVSPGVYTATVTPTSEGAVSLNVEANVAQDAAGNPNTASTETSTTNFDTTSPSVVISTDATHTNGPFTATFTFSEAVTGFEASDITIANGTVGSLSTSDNITYTTTITPTTSFTGSLTLDVFENLAEDSAGNGNTPASQRIIAVDQSRPSVSVSIPSGPANVPFTATFTFSEAVTGFEASDINLTNGTLSNFTEVSPGVYTATVTPTADGTVTVEVPADVAQDSAGNGNEASSSSVVFDSARPSLAITTSADPANGPFTATFTFSEAVTGFEASDITIANGTVGSMSTSDNITYTTTITPTTSFTGSLTLDVFENLAEDAAGNGNTPASQRTIAVDQSRPSVSVSIPSGPANVPFTATFTFSEAVTGFEASDINLTNGTLSNFTEVSPGVYTATVTPTADGTVTVEVPADVAQDAAGNPNTASTETSTINFDTTSPSVVISTDATNTNGPFTATFTFSEAVTGFEASDISITNGTVSNLTEVSPGVYTATVTPTSEGAVSLNVEANVAQDAAGNPNTASTETSTTNFDTTSPSVVISTDVTTTNGPFTATFTFSEAVTGFEASDITIANGTVSNLTEVSPGVYTATVTPTSEGAVSLNVEANVAQDAAGNPNTASTETSTTNFDTTSPSVVISTDATHTNGPFTATFTFSEAVTGFEASDINLTNGTLSNFTEVSPGVYTATVTPTADGTVTVEVPADVAQDSAGNGNEASSSSVTFDSARPSLAITTSADPANGPFTMTFTFSEAVTGFEASDITIANGTVGSMSTSDNITYTTTITPTTSFTGSLTLDVFENLAEDSAGNGNTPASQRIIAVDQSRPSVSVSVPSGPVNGPFTATFTFSEAVTGFEASDINLTNGTLSNFTEVSPGVYTATVTPTAEGRVSLSVEANAAQDAAGNPNEAAETSTTNFDTTSPSVVISADVTNTNGPFTATFTFSEAVTGFEASDISIANGTVSNLIEVSPGVYTATVTPTSEGAVSLNVEANIAQDTAGNPNTASTETSTTNFDTTSPSVVISADVTNTNGPFTATFTFSESVTGFEASDISIANGTVSNLIEVSPGVYTATVTPTSEGAVSLNVEANVAQDAAGNPNAAAETSTVTFDTTGPSVVISTDASANTNGPFTATFTFSEAVTGFEASDISIANGTISNLIEVSPGVYTATVTPTSEGAVSLNVEANVAQDAAGNPNTASTETSTTNFDTTSPSVVISTDVTNTNGPFTATFTFSEAVTGFEVSDITITNGTAGSLSTSDNITYTSTITPKTSFTGSLTLDVFENLAEDAAGNGNTPASQRTIAVDQNQPSVTVTAPSGPVNDSFTATFTFSEAVTGFEASDITVANGTVSNLTEVSPSVYTATITPTILFTGDLTLDVAANVATDDAGNGNTPASQRITTIDQSQSNVLITGPEGPLNKPFIVTFTFSETVTGFEGKNISIINGTISDFLEIGPGIFTALVTPTADGEVIVQVPANVAEDSAGNGNLKSNEFIVLADLISPVLLVQDVPTLLNSFDSFALTYVADERIKGFEITDLIAVNADLSAFKIINDRTFQVTVTPNQQVTVTISLPENSLTDLAGNPNLQSLVSEIPFNAAPTDISLSSITIDENSISPEIVGLLSSTDANLGDVHEYTLLLGRNEFAVNLNALMLRPDVDLDFETKSSYDIRLRTEDGNGGAFEKNFVISINDINEGPTDMLLSNIFLTESDDSNLFLGMLSTIDQDIDESFAYRLIEGGGDDHNDFFRLEGDEIYTSQMINFEFAEVLSIRLEVTDKGGLTFEKIFEIVVGDIELETLRDFTKDFPDARIKNFFTPNGDGINDFWVIEDILDNPINTVKVWSQDGQLVFEASNYQNDWGGTYKSERLPSGSYYYEVNVYNGEAIIRGILLILEK